MGPLLSHQAMTMLLGLSSDDPPPAVSPAQKSRWLSATTFAPPHSGNRKPENVAQYRRPCSAYAAGDINNDGHVDLTDVGLILSGFGISTCAAPSPLTAAEFARADVNSDCALNITDLNIVLSNFGQSGDVSAHRMLVWDAESRLIRVEPSSPVSGNKKVEYTYDYLGRRVQRKVFTHSPRIMASRTTAKLSRGFHRANSVELPQPSRPIRGEKVQTPSCFSELTGQTGRWRANRTVFLLSERDLRHRAGSSNRQFRGCGAAWRNQPLTRRAPFAQHRRWPAAGSRRQ